eukprot:gene8141-1389_t
MGCITGIIGKIFQVCLGLLKIAAAVAILIIVTQHLVDISVISIEDVNVTIVDAGLSDLGTFSCLLGQLDSQYNSDVVNLCTYAYAVAGFSLFCTLVLFILLCVTCGCCGCGFIFESMFAIVGTLWWLGASIVFTKYGKEANDNMVPEEHWRNSVIAASWVAFSAFALTTLMALLKILDCATCGICS